MAPTPDSPTIPFTRRRVLGWGGAGVIGGLAGYWGWQHPPTETAIEAPAASARPLAANPPESLADSSSAGALPPADGILREDFLPHLKSAFQLDSGTRCTLVEVGPAQKLVSPTAGFTSFSLLFTAPIDFAAESKIYHLTHGRMIAIDLFLSPVGRSKEHLHLEAVCSQRV